MQKNTISRIHSLVLTCAFMAAWTVADAKESTPPQVRATSYGLVQGVNDKAGSGTYFWEGIPFAEPPIGALRWKAPIEPEPWKGTLVTQEFGNACIQNGRIYGPGANNTYDATIGTTLNTPVGSEDCLTLNIWRPANDNTNLPVILYVYGGSNNAGYTADPVYNGANLAKRANAIVVTANYRVGVMGFLNVAQLKTGTDAASDSGNFALLDIIQALKFINKNIPNFGGDKNNVTIMGQSAGAINTWAVVTSPLSKGLIHKAIPMSGGISLSTNLPKGMFPTLFPAPFYAAQGSALLNTLLIEDGKVTDNESAKAYIATQSSAQVANYLRSKDANVILTTLLTKLTPKGMGISGPVPDGAVLPLDPIAAIAEGNYRKVPILVTNTAEEGKLFAPFLALAPALGGKPGFIVDDATRFKMMATFNGDAVKTTATSTNGLAFFPFDAVPANDLVSILHKAGLSSSLDITDIINPAYLPVDAPTTGWSARTALFSNIFFGPSRNNVMDALLKQQSNVWYSQFNWAQEPAPWNDVYGAAHLFDVPFIFGNFGPSVFSNAINSTANKPGREALSAAMMDTIAAFIKNGDPNNASLGVKWEPWPKKLIFDATLMQKKISVE
ncbi:MAG: carboxylesterase/lipase family protein [Burkholderiaceae bacterium]